MRRAGLLASWVAAAVVLACSGDGDKRKTIDPGGTGGRSPLGTGGSGQGASAGAAGASASTGGRSGRGGAGATETGGRSTGTAGAAGGEALSPAPVVAITSPGEDGEIITTGELEVLCVAEQSSMAGSKPVNAVSIRLLVDDVEVDEVPGTETRNADEYSATFPTQNLENGAITVECEADDTSRPVLTGSDQRQAFLDHGPTIVVDAPQADVPLPLLQPAHFDFTVEAAPIERNDPDADVEGVQLQVAGVDIPRCEDTSSGPCFAEDPDQAGRFTADIDLSDTFYFNPTPETAQVIVTAVNGRAASRSTQLSFPLDGTGPELTFQSPNEGAVVRGRVSVEFSVSDESGIDEDTLSVEVSGFADRFAYPTDGEWRANPSSDGTSVAYQFRFDTVTLPLTQSDLQLTVRVRDAVGNRLPGGGAVLNLALDNVPPIVDLDPGLVREMDWLNRTERTKKCSPLFSPITQDPDNQYAPQPDGTVTSGIVEVTFRALVWDETNGAPGDPYITYSLVDQDSVFLYARSAADAATEPLVFDSTGDGVCDQVDDTTAVQDLDPVNPSQKGTPWYTNNTGLLDLATAPTSNECQVPTTDPIAPTNLCTAGSHDMYYVMLHPTVPQSVREPVVYGIPPLTGEACTGDGWPLTQESSIGEGWVCVAARALDNVGNRGISAPLRICFDSPDIPGTPDCSPEAMPRCTDGCTLPKRFEPRVIDRSR